MMLDNNLCSSNVFKGLEREVKRTVDDAIE